MFTPTAHKASFSCVTYRRPRLVEELLYCLLETDWPDFEIVIVNDEPEQTLVFDHPQVRIINWPRRFSTFGLKRNYAASLCTGNYIFPVDDDDLYLPHKVEQAVSNISSFGVFKTDLIVVDSDPLELTYGRLVSNYMFTKDAFIACSGFDICDPHGGCQRLMNVTDMFMERTASPCRAVSAPSYVYRRHTTPYHDCARGPTYPADSEMERGAIELEPRKASIDTRTISPVDKGRRIAGVLPFVPIDLTEFYKGIKQ